MLTSSSELLELHLPLLEHNLDLNVLSQCQLSESKATAAIHYKEQQLCIQQLEVKLKDAETASSQLSVRHAQDDALVLRMLQYNDQYGLPDFLNREMYALRPHLRSKMIDNC